MQIQFNELTDTPSHKYQPGVTYEVPDKEAEAFIEAGKASEPKKRGRKPREEIEVD